MHRKYTVQNLVYTSISSLTIVSVVNTGKSPSSAVRQSIKAKELQLCMGSGLPILEAHMQELMTLCNNGRICFKTNFSPNSPPRNQVKIAL